MLSVTGAIAVSTRAGCSSSRPISGVDQRAATTAQGYGVGSNDMSSMYFGDNVAAPEDPDDPYGSGHDDYEPLEVWCKRYEPRQRRNVLYDDAWDELYGL